MTVYRGGTRARLVRRSFCEMLETALTDLGWFDGGRNHQSITFVTAPIDVTQAVPINTLAVSDDDVFNDDAELGSMLAEYRTTYYVDFFGESAALAKHISGDIHDILAGRYESVGRTAPIVSVLDYFQATPTEIFVCELEGVTTLKAPQTTKAFEKHWYSTRVTVIDTYGDSS